MEEPRIRIKNARTHNLKSIDLELIGRQLICFSGVSGSGKSSLAFDTIYVEGQRRYIESLSQHTQRFLGHVHRADVDKIEGITPTISIEQKTANKNPRSTVGTLTEIYDFLRVLYARLAIPYCPISQEPVQSRSKEEIIHQTQQLPQGLKVVILAPYARGKKGQFKEDMEEISRKGFTKARIDTHIVSLSEEIALDGALAHDIDIVIDRLEIQPIQFHRLTESIQTALTLGNGICILWDMQSGVEHLFSMHAYSPRSGLSYPPLDPNDFSFNTPSGMCPQCQGLGSIQEFDLSRIIDTEKSISEDCCAIAGSYHNTRYHSIYESLAHSEGFDTITPWKHLSSHAQNVFLYGTQALLNIPHSSWGSYSVHWQGVIKEAQKRYKEGKNCILRAKWHKYFISATCSSCQGEKLKPYPRAARFHGMQIAQLTAQSIEECLIFFEKINLSPQEQLIGSDLIEEIKNRLFFLNNVGLHYLSLNRGAQTLSGGESQRVRLASQIGSGLTGVTYILDEPSIGLHPKDNKKLISTLKQLRDKGNTVIVVEHDEETLFSADQIVDIGPLAGEEGGRIVYQGPISGILKNKQSITGAYLSGRKSIPIPSSRRKGLMSTILLTGAHLHNLKKNRLEIPLGCFVAVTGVSGSGKSSLIIETLFPLLSNHLSGTDLKHGPYESLEGIEYIDKIIEIDQSPIGRTPRSNPATYIKLFDDIRHLFCQLPESLARGFKPGRFSFNVMEGSCSHCNGLGAIKVDMDFMEEEWIECPLCQGQRFDEETLSIRFKEKNIHNVLSMTVQEALEHFDAIPSIKKKLMTLSRVGLNYIQIGQWATTLSGGEAQRIKLAKELTRPSTGKTLYILDEPTTGLHFHDIKHLLEVLHTLVDAGNTVVVIEHNMDLIKTADWIIDMGPEGGHAGGHILHVGTPEEISCLNTPTGEAIRDILNPHRLTSLKSLISKKSSPQKQPEKSNFICIQGATQNNLKNLSVLIPQGKISVLCGPSGSGKSSFALDTLYAEGQRRYTDSLPAYARQFIKQIPKPKIQSIEYLPPAVALEISKHTANPRSTVGTLTEIYDYLRILYSRIGIPYCPKTGAQIQAISKEHVLEKILSYTPGEKIHILAPIALSHQDKFSDVVSRLQRQGFIWIRLNGSFFNLDDIENIPYDRKRKNTLYLVIDRFPVNLSLRKRILEAIENAVRISKGKLIILRQEREIFFNLSFSVLETGESYPEITPHLFAFNTREGMCPDCCGVGSYWGLDIQRKELSHLTPLQLCILLWKSTPHSAPVKVLEAFLKQIHIDPLIPFSSLNTKQLSSLLNGTNEWFSYSWSGVSVRFQWVGLNLAFLKLSQYFSPQKASEEHALLLQITSWLQEVECPSCKGSRLNSLASRVELNKMTLPDLCQLPLNQTLAHIQSISLNTLENRALVEVQKQIVGRLRFLNDLGLNYLSLSRRVSTLSSGEEQRIRLSRQLGSGLSGVLYVLEEPTAGLHPQDTQKLLQSLDALKKQGNTLILIEHNPQVILQADHILEFGPASGKQGGHIITQGAVPDILSNTHSPTRPYLQKVLPPLKKKPLKDIKDSFFSLKGVKIHNLKSIECSFPLGKLSCITGASGSGKSSLLQGAIQPAMHSFLHGVDHNLPFSIQGHEHFTSLISIEPKQHVLTQRSDIATYVEVLKPLRDFFSSLPSAASKGLLPKHFSYYHPSGMCTSCKGLGFREVQLQFMPCVQIGCEECQGLRLNPLSLTVRYKEKNLSEWLQMSASELVSLFSNHPKIVKILQGLIDVGLGYLCLNQEMNTLSYGEVQRVHLSIELGKRHKDKTLYLMDEPTRGLHGQEVKMLIAVFDQLLDKGSTLLVIEHNLDVIRHASWVVDLGPTGGIEGGYVMATGTPFHVASKSDSSLHPFLYKSSKKQSK